MHWFTGSRSEARRAVALGCYFSVNTEMTRNERGQALVADLPIDRLLTETDGPFTQNSWPTVPSDRRAPSDSRHSTNKRKAGRSRRAVGAREP